MSAPERPVIRYFGGKWILAPWVISHFPPHRVYVEPFGGAASVLMRKPRAYAEVYNDVDGDVVNLFQVLRAPDLAADLERRLRLTPFARQEFDQAYDATEDPVERARRLIIRAYMGFGSNGHTMTRTGFRANSNRSGTTPAHDWTTYPDEIRAITERLTGVVIEHRDYARVMTDHDGPNTLHYVDPPYVLATRSDRKRYTHEFVDADHDRLCDVMQRMEGMVVLSGYEHDAYEPLGWHCVSRKAFADGARERTEVLWLNARAWANQAQLCLDLG